MASIGQEYTASLLKGEYSILWNSTPSDWYVRTPGKKGESTLANTTALDEVGCRARNEDYHFRTSRISVEDSKRP
eukprot:7988833-Lingulodinium_polyedra.AAC.1